MSAQAISHVWDVTGITAEEKLLLLWVANSSGGLGHPVMMDPHGMGEFICADYYRAMTVLGDLADRGLVKWERESEDFSSYIWLAYDGPYEPPHDFIGETKSRSKRIVALIERDGPGCSYCDKTPVNYHVDHFIPKARGGVDAMHNLVLSCPPCNQAKKDKLPEDFLKDDPERLRRLLVMLEAMRG